MAHISLHHLTAMDASPGELVRYAAREHCRLVSLFGHMPAAHRHHYPMVEPTEVEGLARLMHGLGVSCHALEVFPLVRDPDWQAVRQALAIGEALGASFAVVHSQLADPDEAADQLVALSELAAKHGIVPAVEFNPFSHCTSLPEAVMLCRAATERGGACKVILDTLHAARCGTSTAQIARAAPHIAFVQLSDGPTEVADDARWKEAIGERQRPGEGDLPLAAMIAPFGPDMIYDLEVPRRSEREAGICAQDRCTRAIRQGRALLGSR